jgi:hypothetical protein
MPSWAIRELLALLSEPVVPDQRERINSIHGAQNAIHLLFRAIEKYHGIDRTRDMFKALGLPPSNRKLQRLKNEALLDGYDLMEGKQTKLGYAKKIAKDPDQVDSAHTRIKRLIKQREKRDGSIHREIRTELETMRSELKKRSTQHKRRTK